MAGHFNRSDAIAFLLLLRLPDRDRRFGDYNSPRPGGVLDVVTQTPLVLD